MGLALADELHAHMPVLPGSAVAGRGRAGEPAGLLGERLGGPEERDREHTQGRDEREQRGDASGG